MHGICKLICRKLSLAHKTQFIRAFCILASSILLIIRSSCLKSYNTFKHCIVVCKRIVHSFLNSQNWLETNHPCITWVINPSNVYLTLKRMNGHMNFIYSGWSSWMNRNLLKMLVINKGFIDTEWLLIYNLQSTDGHYYIETILVRRKDWTCSNILLDWNMSGQKNTFLKDK